MGQKSAFTNNISNSVIAETEEEAPPPNILVVDDDEHHCSLLRIFLEAEGYTAREAGNGAEAYVCIDQQCPDLILLDVMLPDTDGFEITRQLKQNKDTAGIPIVMVTALDDRAARLRALEAGVEDFLTKPVDRSELVVRVRNLLTVKHYADFLRHHNRLLERQVDEKTQQVRQQCIATVLTLARAAEYRDETTGDHVNRISHYTVALAELLGLDSEFRDQIFYASPMHDIGKLAIPDHILLKPGLLTKNEWAIMKTHTTLGREILRNQHSPYLEMGSEIAVSHHEYWDGSGYPLGLKGEAIPLAARIMVICDVYDALRSKRPYKQIISHEETLEIMRRGDLRTRPTQFDPQIFDVFMTHHGQFEQIYLEFSRRASGH
jgi:putative two-component system response regulator